MAYPWPPQVQLAKDQLVAAIKEVDKKDVDAIATPWPEVEKSVIKILGGAFQMNRPDHQGVALGLSGFFGARLEKDLGAFWFVNRESVEGAVLGFPEALIMLSPFGAVVEALSRANLAKLDDITKDIRNSLAQVKFAAAPAGLSQPRLTPLDYQRLFDPGFVQFVVLDPAKVKQAIDGTPDKAIREVRDAVSRAAKIPPEAKQQFEQQILSAFTRLDAAKPIAQQVQNAPRVSELVAHLFGTVASSGAAPEEFWHDAIMPLLHIGVPDAFPPLGPEELEAAQKGVDPFFLFLDVVPYKTPAPDEGLMGTFAIDELQLPNEAFGSIGSLRLIKLKLDRVKPMMLAFDAAKTKDAIERFRKMVEEKAGKPVPFTPDGQAMLEAAIHLLSDVRKCVETAGDLCIRRITEAEASSEPLLAQVRQSLQGPRLVLVT